MTNEEKELLLKDLSARLPYGVKIEIPELFGRGFEIQTLTEIDRGHINDYGTPCHFIKPYLRPMSSMTEEEKEVVCSMNMISDTELDDRLNYQRMYVQNYTIETFDYFNERKLDYRGLIPMGLALEAPKNMYNIK